MRRLVRVQVDKLFGYVPHDISLRPDHPTILTGPNGVGKTHVLLLIQAAISLDVRALGRIPFGQLQLTFNDGARLRISRTMADEGPELAIAAFTGNRQQGEVLTVNVEGLDEDHHERVPPHLRELPDGRWLDTRTGRALSPLALERRYGFRPETTKALFSEHPEILEAIREVKAAMIDTKRLDSLQRRDAAISQRPSTMTGAGLAAPGSATPISQYIAEIKAQVGEARRLSVSRTQSRDLSFAMRALAAAGNRVREPDLRRRYQGIVETYKDLADNGLAMGEAPPDLPAFPDNTTPTVRRILDLFLDDWAARLEVLLPVNSKLTVLRRILDEKFATTGKRTRMSEQGNLGFVGHAGKRVLVKSLSSGEQHLVALYTMLLFTAEPQSLVLIDEPELSMHAAWKHAFLRDIAEVAELASLQIVLATHSSAIVNGRWDLTEELEPATDLAATVAADDEPGTAEEAEDWLVV